MACVTVLPVKKGCPDAGYGVVGGKGLRKPLPPAPRREATKPGCRAEAAIQRKKKRKKSPRPPPGSIRQPANGKENPPPPEKTCCYQWLWCTLFS